MNKKINTIIENIELGKIVPKEGALKFFNIWFGRPYDNIHKITSVKYINDVLEVNFDEGEILKIYNPKGIVIDANCFKVKTASKIEWKWYLYGEEKSEANKRFWVLQQLFHSIIQVKSNDVNLKSGYRFIGYKNALEIL